MLEPCSEPCTDFHDAREHKAYNRLVKRNKIEVACLMQYANNLGIKFKYESFIKSSFISQYLMYLDIIRKMNCAPFIMTCLNIEHSNENVEKFLRSVLKPCNDIASCEHETQTDHEFYNMIVRQYPIHKKVYYMFAPDTNMDSMQKWLTLCHVTSKPNMSIMEKYYFNPMRILLSERQTNFLIET